MARRYLTNVSSYISNSLSSPCAITTATTATPNGNTGLLVHPAENALNNVLTDFMLQVTDDSQPENTQRAYLLKLKEFGGF